jgi:hypothetical protein
MSLPAGILGMLELRSIDIFVHHKEHLTSLQLLVLHMYVAAGWYRGSVGTPF